MGNHHSKSRQQQQNTSPSFQNDAADLPPTYTEVFEDTPRTLQSDKVATKSRTTENGHEAKRDELLLAVKDRERELIQTINQVRAEKRYTESVIASLEQEVRTLKQSLRQKAKDTTSLEEQLEETKKLVEDRNSHIKVLLEKRYSESVRDCQHCKDLEQQLRKVRSEHTEERDNLTTQVYALGCLIDFDDRYIKTLCQRLGTCRIASMRVPPQLDSEEGVTKSLDEAEISQKQRETKHQLIEAALYHQMQILTWHLNEAYAESSLSGAGKECRTDDSSLANDDRNAIEDAQDFWSIKELYMHCFELCWMQRYRGRAEKTPRVMEASNGVDSTAGGMTVRCS